MLTYKENLAIPDISESEKLSEIVLPILRGIFQNISKISWIFHFRYSHHSLEFANSKEVESWSQRGTLTPGTSMKYLNPRSRNKNKRIPTLTFGYQKASSKYIKFSQLSKNSSRELHRLLS